LLTEIDWSAVASAVPQGELLKIRPDLAARLWPDPDDARFAAEFGVPYTGGLFTMVSGVAGENPGRPSDAYENEPESGPKDTPVGRLFRFGWFSDDTAIYVNTADGAIWFADSNSDVEYELAHRDLSSLTYMLYLLESERPAEGTYASYGQWDESIRLISEKITQWDELPCAEPEGYWRRFFISYSMY
jgi:hypothetical protein